MTTQISRIIRIVTLILALAAMATPAPAQSERLSKPVKGDARKIPGRDGAPSRLAAETIKLEIRSVTKRDLKTISEVLQESKRSSRVSADRPITGGKVTVEGSGGDRQKDNVAVDFTWSADPPAGVSIKQFDIALTTTNTDGSTTTKRSDSKHPIDGSARQATLTIPMAPGVFAKTFKVTLTAHVESAHTNGTNNNDTNNAGTHSGDWTFCTVDKSGAFPPPQRNGAVERDPGKPTKSQGIGELKRDPGKPTE